MFAILQQSREVTTTISYSRAQSIVAVQQLQQPLLIINRVAAAAAAPFNLYSGCVPLSFSCINKIINQSWDNLIDRTHSHCLFRTYKCTCYCLAFTCVKEGDTCRLGPSGLDKIQLLSNFFVEESVRMKVTQKFRKSRT